jgi:3-mercaptopyruvate sulfurtransferase SseA
MYAARALAAMGYSNVRAYEGGKQEWQEAGLPLEKGGAGGRTVDSSTNPEKETDVA